jgi:hypothetical protein
VKAYLGQMPIEGGGERAECTHIIKIGAQQAMTERFNLLNK